NYLVKMNLLDTSQILPARDYTLPVWDGGNIETNLYVMAKESVGLPPEAAHPEINAGNELWARDAGDDPDIMDGGPSPAPQRAGDGFSLRDTVLHMKIPQAIDVVPLPADALTLARYRATSYELGTGSDLSSLDWYRSELAAGREVIIQFWCCDGFDQPVINP